MKMLKGEHARAERAYMIYLVDTYGLRDKERIHEL